MKNSLKFIAFILMLAVAIVGIVALFVNTTFNDTEYTATVTDKQRIEKFVKSENGIVDQSYYLIFCKDNEGNYYEFKNEDSLIRGKLNSSTFYGKIEIGHTYRFKVVGYRIPWMSAYQNIIDFEEVE